MATSADLALDADADAANAVAPRVPVDDATPPEIVRISRVALVVEGACIAVIVAATAFLIAAAVVARSDIELAAVIAVPALFTGWMARIGWRDFRWKSRLRAAFGPTSCALRLSAGRFMGQRDEPFDGDVHYRDIASIESRYEAYGVLGLISMQRSFALRFVDGHVLRLGEVRGLGTNIVQRGIERVAQGFRARVDVPSIDRGMVSRTWLSRTPIGWDAPSLDADAQAKLWRRAMIAGSVEAVGGAIGTYGSSST
jgi:hypothetical protein